MPSLAVDEREYFMQGLEHFIDAAEGMKSGHKYKALLLAESIAPEELARVRLHYEQTATQISPLLKQQISYGENASVSVTQSFSENLSKSLTKTLSETQTTGTSETHTTGTSKTQSTTHTTGTSTSTASSQSVTKENRLAKAAGYLGGLVGSALGAAGGPIGMIAGQALGREFSGALLGGEGSHTKGTTVTTGTSESIANSTSSGTSKSHSTSTNQSHSTATSHGTTQTQGVTTGRNDGQSQGNSVQFNIEQVDKSIGQMLKRIEVNLERLDEAKRYGGWLSAAYFFADNPVTSQTLARHFLSLTRGNESHTENFAVTTWSKPEQKREVVNWLKALRHPKLKAKNLFGENREIELSPATLISGKELALQLCLPRRSISGITVVEAQRFGRQVTLQDGGFSTDKNSTICLGHLRHLLKDLPQEVHLTTNHLASHVFVSGSTGSGKSNTIYHLLSELQKQDIPFLVIEPAKGEYKHVFGNQKDVQVYGSNPQYAPLLTVNPFYFPKGIHVLEHIDRLIEIFNVCWTMYDAMPAVLKEAILQSYQACGWDLEQSQSLLAEPVYPNFKDLLSKLEVVINQSAYSAEVKGNYTGALVTRVKSLTNGLNGMIFTDHALPLATLFEQSTIIDLSRIGAQETKSLLMGLLVM